MTDAPLPNRYSPRDLDVFTPEERMRFVPDGAISEDVAWQLLYRLEPDLYERLIVGEAVHQGVLGWLPRHVRHCLEVGAGTGRLTASLSPRCDALVLVEPSGPLRERLAQRFPDAEIRNGFFDDLPVEDNWADLVVSCSAFRADDRGLAEMERVCAPRGMIALVWPADVDWLRERGFEYVTFDGEMSIAFPSLEEALELARIFYPEAVRTIAERGCATVPYDVVGMNPPCDVAWKRFG